MIDFYTFACTVVVQLVVHDAGVDALGVLARTQTLFPQKMAIRLVGLVGRGAHFLSLVTGNLANVEALTRGLVLVYYACFARTALDTRAKVVAHSIGELVLRKAVHFLNNRHVYVHIVL